MLYVSAGLAVLMFIAFVASCIWEGGRIKREDRQRQELERS